MEGQREGEHVLTVCISCFYPTAMLCLCLWTCIQTSVCVCVCVSKCVKLGPRQDFAAVMAHLEDTGRWGEKREVEVGVVTEQTITTHHNTPTPYASRNGAACLFILEPPEEVRLGAPRPRHGYGGSQC